MRGDAAASNKNLTTGADDRPAFSSRPPDPNREPSFGKEGTEAGQTVKVRHPALGGPPDQEGGVYHILQSQGQIHFGP